MPLLIETTTVPDARLRDLVLNFVTDLREFEKEFSRDVAEPSRAARIRTGRDLVVDTIRWASGLLPRKMDSIQLRASVNLLYDVSLVAAEYYKLYVRQQRTPQRPRRRAETP